MTQFLFKHVLNAVMHCRHTDRGVMSLDLFRIQTD